MQHNARGKTGLQQRKSRMLGHGDNPRMYAAVYGCFGIKLLARIECGVGHNNFRYNNNGVIRNARVQQHVFQQGVDLELIISQCSIQCVLLD